DFSTRHAQRSPWHRHEQRKTDPLDGPTVPGKGHTSRRLTAWPPVTWGHRVGWRPPHARGDRRPRSPAQPGRPFPSLPGPPSHKQADLLQPLLVPSDGAAMTLFSVNPWVNDARHEGPRCLERAGPETNLF